MLLVLRPSDLGWGLHWSYSQAFRLGLNYTTGFLGSPACKGQVRGCLILHNCVSQFLQYISIYLSVYINIYQYLSVYLPIYLSLYLSLYLPAYLLLFLWRILTNTGGCLHHGCGCVCGLGSWKPTELSAHRLMGFRK